MPIANRRAEIQAAIAANQVVIVCGETGSGKTTQLPKICLELKRGIYGTIGCTQPRRIAARSVAARIAQELQTQVGELVGYKVRFTDRVQEDTLVKVMTDGILLAEVHSDRWLSQHDTFLIMKVMTTEVSHKASEGGTVEAVHSHDGQEGLDPDAIEIG